MHEELLLPLCSLDFGFGSVSLGLRECDQSAERVSGVVAGSLRSYCLSSTCGRGVASMGIYVDNVLKYVTQGASLNYNMSFDPGTYDTVVEEWDYCGGATYTHVKITVSNQTGVWVTSPVNNSNVGSPVNYVATASTGTCQKGVASMGIYVNNVLTYVTQGASLNHSLKFNPGTYNTVVEEWDYCGGAAYTPIKITVTGGGGGSTLYGIQGSKGWVAYGEYPPNYNICTQCGSGVTWSMNQHIQSPSLSGNATEFGLGGTTAYSDVLFTNPLIGQNSSQGLPDNNHTLIPSLHNFTYDAEFTPARFRWHRPWSSTSACTLTAWRWFSGRSAGLPVATSGMSGTARIHIGWRPAHLLSRE